MPNKKDELIKKYKEWSGRLAPIFDNAHVDLTSIVDAGNDNEFDIDNNNDIVAMWNKNNNFYAWFYLNDK